MILLSFEQLIFLVKVGYGQPNSEFYVIYNGISSHSKFLI